MATEVQPLTTCNLDCTSEGDQIKREEGEVAGHVRPYGETDEAVVFGPQLFPKKKAAASESDLSRKRSVFLAELKLITIKKL